MRRAKGVSHDFDDRWQSAAHETRKRFGKTKTTLLAQDEELADGADPVSRKELWIN